MVAACWSGVHGGTEGGHGASWGGAGARAGRAGQALGLVECVGREGQVRVGPRAWERGAWAGVIGLGAVWPGGGVGWGREGGGGWQHARNACGRMPNREGAGLGVTHDPVRGQEHLRQHEGVVAGRAVWRPLHEGHGTRASKHVCNPPHLPAPAPTPPPPHAPIPPLPHERATPAPRPARPAPPRPNPRPRYTRCCPAPAPLPAQVDVNSGGRVFFCFFRPLRPGQPEGVAVLKFGPNRLLMQARAESRAVHVPAANLG